MTVNGVIDLNDSDGCPLCRCCGVCFATQWYFLVATRKLESHPQPLWLGLRTGLSHWGAYSAPQTP